MAKEAKRNDYPKGVTPAPERGHPAGLGAAMVKLPLNSIAGSTMWISAEHVTAIRGGPGPNCRVWVLGIDEPFELGDNKDAIARVINAQRR